MKKNLPSSGFSRPGGPEAADKRKQRDKYLNLAGELKERRNMKMTVISILICAIGTILKSLEKTAGNGYQKKNRDHLDYNIFEIG